MEKALLCLPCKSCDTCGKVTTSVNYIWDVWNQRSHKIKDTEFTIIGFSVAALRTNFYIKELNIMFDGGLSSNYSPSHVFITHLHTDHIANVPWHFVPGEPRNVQIYVPQFTAVRMKPFLEASHPYQGQNDALGEKSQNHDAYKIIEVEDKINVPIEIKGKKHILEIIRCYHTVRCTSYGLIEIKTKLKQEYLGLKGAEIKELRQQGVELTEQILKPYFLYIGDTSKEILKDERLKKYSTIMIECTFIDDEEEERATLTEHMHWKHLEQYVIDNPNINFILYHFSSRYKRDHIDDFFNKINLSNVIVWNSN